MKAQVGDVLVVKGYHLGEPARRGVIAEVHGADGAPPYLVQWSDGHESSFYPSSDAVVEHKAARRKAAKHGGQGHHARR